MNCKDADELMSLKLDGMLASEGELELRAHMENCHDCAPLWEAMLEADNLIAKWVAEPLAVPAGLHMKIMTRISAMQVARPASAAVAGPVVSRPATSPVQAQPLFQQPTRPLTGPLPGQLTEYLRGWQSQIAAWTRVAAVAGASMLGTIGLVILLVATHVITLDGSFADLAQSLGTAVSATGTWSRSLFVGLGPEVWVVGATIMGLLTLVGWQVVASYQRSAAEQRRNTGYLEAAG